MKLFLIVTSVMLLASCTTITISEKDAFDVKRTIDDELIRATGSVVESVQIETDDNLLLDGWWITQENAIGVVLYFGGNGFVRVASQHIIDAFLQHPVNLLVFDYRGYGQNEGKPTVDGLKIDGTSAYQFLMRQGVSPEKVVIHGHSMGSFVATHVAQSPNAGLVLECPITDVKDMTDQLVPWFVKPLIKFDIDTVLLRNSNLERIENYTRPLLIIAGETDKITPPAMAETLYEQSISSDKSLLIIPDGGHNDLPNTTVYADSLASFYRSVFSGRELR